ncbi:MAG: hypothetical protein MI754_15540 [Chromatiales bacterium]|nr:hypothetical protein [Chromatiales bacterium]
MLHLRGWVRLAKFFARFNLLVHKVSISPQSCIGPGCRLSHPPGVIFHGQAGRSLTLFSMAVCCADEFHHHGDLQFAPVLGDNVQLGGHAVVIGPIQVGSDTKISYLVKLAENVSPNSLVVSRAMHINISPRE